MKKISSGITQRERKNSLYCYLRYYGVAGITTVGGYGITGNEAMKIGYAHY